MHVLVLFRAQFGCSYHSVAELPDIVVGNIVLAFLHSESCVYVREACDGLCCLELCNRSVQRLLLPQPSSCSVYKRPQTEGLEILTVRPITSEQRHVDRMSCCQPLGHAFAISFRNECHRALHNQGHFERP